MKPKIFSIFSGAGGLDIGFRRAGFDIALSTDYWQPACNTLEKNGFNDTICDDISNIDFKTLAKKNGPIDGVIGGPPCPPFSKSRFYLKNKTRGMDDYDGESSLKNFIRCIKETKPKFFLFENVYGFAFKPHKSSLDFLTNEVKKLGFDPVYKIINTADFGVPQTRERFICIGVLDRNYKFPNPSHSKEVEKNRKPWVTAGDVLNDIDYDLPEDKKMQAGSKHKNLLKEVPPGDNYLFFTEKRGHQNPQFKWRSRYWSFLLKLSPERPSWTIQASHSNNMGPFHWKNRFLRIPEIKRLQSFPDNYELTGSFSDQWRQVGNAVPPKLAYILAKSIKKYL
ncbi:DNA cytosine methyltransferase [Gammaproteobacteria bacterium]|nr:DNA cytosine methyltransferase [Gammaproteobacteria bacterium]